MPFFTIIIPVYNVEQYLKDCLDAVISQSCTDYEAICVNDGSTDGSLSILNDYASKYPQIKIIDQDNKGLGGARNTGIDHSSGEYIFFLDSDDWLEPDALEILKKETGKEDFVAFNGHRYFEDGRKEIPDVGIVESKMTGWDYYQKYALLGRKFHFVCVVLRLYKRAFLQANALRFEEHLYHEDNLFTPIVCYYAKSVKVIPDILYVYRIRKQSIMTNSNVRHLVDTVHVANALATFFDDKVINKTVLYREIAGEYLNGFTEESIKVFGNHDKQLQGIIKWNLCRQVCIYPRHRRLFLLMKLSPSLMRFYMRIERFVKCVIG